MQIRMKRYREAVAPSNIHAVPSFRFASSRNTRMRMDLLDLTRALVDIESVTNHEKSVGDYVFAHLSTLAARHDGHLERIPAEPNRDNIFASSGQPVVTLSTHLDTVPPFFASREDDEFIWGRGACDAKGIIA